MDSRDTNLFNHPQPGWEVSQSRGLFPESEYIVTVESDKISCTNPEGTVSGVAWQDLQTVMIETNDLGPFEPDVFWVVVGTQSRCIVPQGATGEKVLMEKLQELPNFNHDAFIEAMSSSENRTFVCWQRGK